jgi:hypothetical protein
MVDHLRHGTDTGRFLWFQNSFRDSGVGFCGGRAPAERAQLSPLYALHVETWLRDFAKTFPGHSLGDLNREFLAQYMDKFAELSPKSRNDRRATVAMFLRWCVRQDYLAPTHLVCVARYFIALEFHS